MSGEPRFHRASALIVVDVQNDFADPVGSLFVPGGDRVATEVAALMRRAAAMDALVVCTQDWHPSVTPHFREFGGVWPRHCVQGTWGAELHPLLPRPVAIVHKGEDQDDGYSGFGVRHLATGEIAPTDLAPLLSHRGVSEVFVVGLALDVCVKATALDAVAAGFQTSLLESATSAVDLKEGDGRRALVELVAAGVTII
ncbi:MAG: isochorismatase family protein [Candidatus Dormibacteria bacterium]